MLENFQIFKFEIEVTCEKLMKCPRLNRKGTYYNTLFFESNIIVYETFTPYTPQQNSVIKKKKRKKKDFNGNSHTLLSNSKLGHKFCSEALLLTYHL